MARRIKTGKPTGSGKPSGARPKLPLRREFSAGGIVWRRGGHTGVEVVLIRPRGSHAWCLPKGHIEKGESVHDAAVREVAEETGLTVGAVEKLGDLSYVFSWREQPKGELTRVFKRVYYFAMQYAGGDPAGHDSEIDEVVWLDINDAIARDSYRNERALLEKARDMLLARGVGEHHVS